MRNIALGLVCMLTLTGCKKLSNSLEELWTGTPHCDRSPHDRLPDSVILEKIRKDAFGDDPVALQDAIKEGRVHWSWNAAPGRKWPNSFGSKNVYSGTAVVVSYVKTVSDGPNNLNTYVEQSDRDMPGVSRVMRLFGYGFDACGNIIGGRDGVERSGYIGDKK